MSEHTPPLFTEVKWKCGCVFHWPPSCDSHWTQCPLHEAAPGLLEACKQLVAVERGDGDRCDYCHVKGHKERCPVGSAEVAIAKAEGAAE